MFKIFNFYALNFTQLAIYSLEGVLVLPDPELFLSVVGSAKPDFTPDPDRLELAKQVFRLIEAVDYIAPSSNTS